MKCCPVYNGFRCLLMLLFLSNQSTAGEHDKNISPMDLREEPFQVLVTLGESTTAGGWSSNRQRCWASRLADLINDMQEEPVQLFNVGIGANVISTLSPAYEQSLNQKMP